MEGRIARVEVVRNALREHWFFSEFDLVAFASDFNFRGAKLFSLHSLHWFWITQCLPQWWFQHSCSIRVLLPLFFYFHRWLCWFSFHFAILRYFESHNVSARFFHFVLVFWVVLKPLWLLQIITLKFLFWHERKMRNSDTDSWNRFSIDSVQIE